MELVAIEGRARKQGRAQGFERNSAVRPPSNPRGAWVDVGARADEGILEVERLLCSSRGERHREVYRGTGLPAALLARELSDMFLSTVWETE